MYEMKEIQVENNAESDLSDELINSASNITLPNLNPALDCQEIQNEEIYQAQVLSVSWKKRKGFGKTLKLECSTQNNSIITLYVPRSACITKGDIIYSPNKLCSDTPLEELSIFVRCKNGISQILPIYHNDIYITIGSKKLGITIKEISSQDEHDGYIALTNYHYRNKKLFGRHATLIVKANDPMLPNVIGYIELTSAFLVNTPRKNILDEPTSIGEISWNRWTKDVCGIRISLFLRIARCVVHPELRSVGLGKILVENAAQFAKHHWNSGHWKPHFLEISADMLKFVPFAEKAGMFYVGETEGNLKRIAKDLNYLRSYEKRIQKKDRGGIFDAKLSQLRKASGIVGKRSSISKFITEQINKPTLDGWAKLAGVLSLPKPHFIMGLDKEAKEMLSDRLKTKHIPNYSSNNSEAYIANIYNSRLKEPIKLNRVSYELNFSVTRTEITHQIERSFEISLDNIPQTIIKNLNFDILPGEIIVLTGLSGSGKTTLMGLLAKKIKLTSGGINMPENVNVGLLTKLDESKPIIEVIDINDVGKSIYFLSVVGLSEPFLFVKSFSALSAGQKYRAMLAQLLSQGSNLWLIDEFCENLDLINTQLVAQKISNLARKVGATVVVASSDATRFVKSLNPDKVLVLKGATDTVGYELLNGKNFIDQFI